MAIVVKHVDIKSRNNPKPNTKPNPNPNHEKIQ